VSGRPGRLLDASGAPIVGAHALTVRVYDGTGALRDTQVFDPVELSGGFYSLTLADVDVDWLGAGAAVGIAVDSNDPADELAPRHALVATPRAAVAEVALGVRRVASPTGACDPGEVVFDTAERRLRFCETGDWGLAIVQQTGFRRWADGTHAASCEAYLHPGVGYEYLGATGDGVYRIDPGGTGPIDVWCDMSHHDGGWTQVLNLDTNDANTRHYFDDDFWTGTSAIGAAADHFTMDHRSGAFSRVAASEIMILAHNEGGLLGTAAYVTSPTWADKTLQWMLANLSNQTVTGTRVASSGAVGTHGRARNAGDAFIDNPHALIINSRYAPHDGENYTRIGTNYADRCPTINCDGHNYGGLGGRHYRSTWGAYYEGAALNGYCNAQGGYGSNGSLYSTNNAFNGCGASLVDVDVAIFVR
jgi:hypothetical protein